MSSQENSQTAAQSSVAKPDNSNGPPAAQIAAALQLARRKLKESRERQTEPVAIVGVGCRFPGAPTPEAYWQLLATGQSGLSSTPKSRWDRNDFAANQPKQPGKITSDQAGFLEEVDRFDATFFGISSREAASLDPQHRLLFEVAWETLENAGANPDRLRGARCGAFIGACSNDYLHLLTSRDAELIDAYLGTGNAHSSAAGRLSYFLDWRGPSVAVDTACSSSLTAVHYAAQSLRAGECEVALAGGVNLILTPELSINLSQAGMLSPSGLSRAFCRGGDGFVRGEGCGLVLLKRLSAAVADGDQIYCVLRGTAVNQDGRSNGLTAPNGPAQQAVIRQALQASGLKPADIDYLEAHGTGTELGDPTEMGALGAVFGTDRDHPLQVGTAKTNIGHLEGAAGIAGLIKACLSLANEELPPHPLLEPNSEGPNGPSPHIDWSLPITVPTQRTPWKRTEDRVRRAGVSSFGFGGTNAHAILEEAPGEGAGSRQQADGSGSRWVNLSARTPAALNALVKRYANELPEASLEAIAYAANTGRAAHAERLAIEASSRDELIKRLANWTDELTPHTARGEAHRTATSGWLFGGQGGCRPGMGRELHERYPLFKEAWDACDAILQPLWPRSLQTICWDEPQRLETVDAQIALVAWQLSLAELWKAWTGSPTWVVGHSLGEFAAAVTAGILNREEALQLVCRRAELLDGIKDRGGMLAVMAGQDKVAPLLGKELSIAAENGPRQTVVSGTDAALDAFASQCQTQKIRTKRLATTHAFHSQLVEGVLAEFTKACEAVTLNAPQLGFISTLTGQPLETPPPADYWAQQMRQPVKFAQAMAQTPSDALRLEFSPTPTLRGLAEGEVQPAAGWKAGEEASLAEASAAKLWTQGLVIDYRAVHPPQRLSVILPTYPFERQRHWFKAPKKRANIAGERVHQLLGVKLDLSSDSIVFESDLSEHAWLADHKLRGKPTLPAVAYLELAWAVGKTLDAKRAWQVIDLQLERPLSWDSALDTEADAVRLQTVVTTEGDAHRVAFMHRAAEGWRRVANCCIERIAVDASEPPIKPADLEDREVAAHYAACREAGLDYGPAFQSVVKLAGTVGQAWAELEPPTATPTEGYLLPPPLADAALQAIAAALPKAWNNAWLPKKVAAAALFQSGEDGSFTATIRLLDDLTTEQPPESLRVEIEISSATGALIARLTGIELTRLSKPKRTHTGESAKAVTASNSAVLGEEEQSALAALATATSSQRRGLLLEHVRRRLAVVMDMTVEELHPDGPLDTLGLDSLMAFELRDDLEGSLGVEVPMDIFLQRMTLAELANVVAQRYEQQTSGGTMDDTSEPESQAVENWVEGAL